MFQLLQNQYSQAYIFFCETSPRLHPQQSHDILLLFVKGNPLSQVYRHHTTYIFFAQQENEQFALDRLLFQS